MSQKSFLKSSSSLVCYILIIVFPLITSGKDNAEYFLLRCLARLKSTDDAANTC